MRKKKTGRHLRARAEFYRARMSSRCTYLPIYICKKWNHWWNRGRNDTRILQRVQVAGWKIPSSVVRRHNAGKKLTRAQTWESLFSRFTENAISFASDYRVRFLSDSFDSRSKRFTHPIACRNFYKVTDITREEWK